MCSLLVLARKTAVTSGVRTEICCELSFHAVILSFRSGVTYEADYSDIRLGNDQDLGARQVPQAEVILGIFNGS